MGKVFVSYRRADWRSGAELVTDRLRRMLGRGQVFFAADDIERGEDFQARIEREIGRARNKFERYYWGAVQGLAERADLLNQYQFHYGDPGALSKDLARYAKLTRASVRQWAGKVLKDDERLVLRVVPASAPPPQGSGSEQ